MSIGVRSAVLSAPSPSTQARIFLAYSCSWRCTLPLSPVVTIMHNNNVRAIIMSSAFSSFSLPLPYPLLGSFSSFLARLCEKDHLAGCPGFCSAARTSWAWLVLAARQVPWPRRYHDAHGNLHMHVYFYMIPYSITACTTQLPLSRLCFLSSYSLQTRHTQHPAQIRYIRQALT